MTLQDVVIYSKPHCPSCVKAKALFDNMEIKYRTLTLGTDIQPSELMTLFEEKGLPAPRTAPQIIFKGKYMGGYHELEKHLETGE